MTKEIQRIKTLCGSHYASIYAKWLSAVQTWENSAALFRSVGQAAEKGTLLDHLAVLRYALVFKSLGFLPSFEPTGLKGPDLLILRDTVAATVEITRFRPMNPGPPVLTKEEYLQDDFLLEPYGNPQRDIVKCLEKVRDKFSQQLGPAPSSQIGMTTELSKRLRCATHFAICSEIWDFRQGSRWFSTAQSGLVTGSGCGAF